MKFVVSHLQGSLANTHSEFTEPKFLIGRDSSKCRLCFTEQDSGVSRCHAEITLQNGFIVLTDLQSSQGTFVNNQRISTPVQLSVGSIIQFGAGGPVLRVEFIDTNIPTAIPSPFPVASLSANLPAGTKEVSNQQFPSSGNVNTKATDAYLEFLQGTNPQRFKLSKETVGIGREENNQICLDSNIFTTVSRHHAKIVFENGEYLLSDLGSFNGTLLDGQRIASAVPLRNGNYIQIGYGGPEFHFVNSAQVSTKVSSSRELSGTMVIKAIKPSSTSNVGEQRQFVVRKEFITDTLTLGRTPDNDLQLDVLQISKNHARFIRSGNSITVEDAGSTNGVYVNGQRTTRAQISSNDLVQIGPYLLQVDISGIIVSDSRSKSRIDVLDLTKEVKNRDGSGTIKLLDRVRLSIQPNEFVGLLGPSGAGKSTLMDALNGMRPAEQGQVLVNNVSLYENINSFKQSIGYVPQDDIIHRELTVYRTLYYVAKMRLSSDTSDKEMDNIIDEVMDITGLTARRNVQISQLSGGQRKRVSIAVELITKPSIIYLDEPTSGLDPGTEEKVMQLFKQISEAGHSVILTTHAMENVKLFDKIVVMMRGRLVWYGPPLESLEYFGIENIKQLFDTLGDPNSDQIAIEWQKKFEQSSSYKKYIVQPLSGLQQVQSHTVRKATNDNTLWQSIRQTFVLAKRYFEVMRADKFNLLILLGQAPLIALLMGLAVGSTWTRDFAYFILALSSVWFGCSNAAREIVKESNVYKRERMVNLGIFPYIFSKLLILIFIGVIQCGLLYGTAALAENIPGNPVLVYFSMLLSTLTGIGIGLLISSAVKTSEVATSLVPLILIPQILFGGLLLPNKGLSEGVGFIMPAMWSYDLMKHIALEDPNIKTFRGIDSEDDEDGELGRIKKANNKNVEQFERDLKLYKTEQQKKLTNYQERIRSAQLGGADPGPMPTLTDPPKAPTIEYPPDDKSNFVGFTSKYGNIPLNLGILSFFFAILILITSIILRSKDVL